MVHFSRARPSFPVAEITFKGYYGHQIYDDFTYFILIMAALWNRTGHYIFALWFLLLSIFLFFSSRILSRRRLDVCHTSTHGVALVRI